MPQLLAPLALTGTIVTADALNGQRAIARQVVERGGDDVLALKGNRGTRHDEVRRFLDDPATPVRSAGSVDGGGHGRIEPRRAVVRADPAWLQERHGWPGPAAIGKVTARRDGDGGTTVKTRYDLLSRAFRPERFGALVRAHRDSENGLRRVPDVALDGDRARAREDHGPENLALLRRLALNLARLEPSKDCMRGELKRAGWDGRFLAPAPFASPPTR